MSVWLGPDEFRRLGSLYPDLAGGSSQKDSLADPSTQRRFDGSGPSAPATSSQDAARIASAGAGPAGVQDNPFLQAMQRESRPVAPVVPADTARITPPVSLVTAPPVPEVTRTPAPPPEAPGSDDRRYFPQLKRF
jgi:hypothetical protein